MNLFRIMLCSIFVMINLQNSFAADFKIEPASDDLSFRGCRDSSAWNILDAENHRKYDADVFQKILRLTTSVGSEDSLSCKKLAIQALGRIGVAGSGALILPYLKHSSTQLRSISAFSLGLLSEPRNLVDLRQRFLVEGRPEVSGALALAIGRLGGADDVTFLAKNFDYQDEPKKLAGLFQGLGILFLKDSALWPVPSDLLNRIIFHATSQNKDVARYAAFAAARYRGKLSPETQEKLILALRVTELDDARAFLVRALTKVKTVQSIKTLCDTYRTALKSEAVKVELLRGLTLAATDSLTDPCMAGVAAQAAVDKSSQVRFQVMGLIAKIPSLASPVLTPLVRVEFEQGASLWVKEEAAKAVTLLDPVYSKSKISGLLDSEHTNDQHLAYVLLTALKAPKEWFSRAFSLSPNSPSKIVQDVVGLVSVTDQGDLVADSVVFARLQADLKSQILRGDIAITSGIAELAAAQKWTTFEESLIAGYDLLTGNDVVEGKLAIIAALGQMGGASSRVFLEKVLDDSERLVVIAAVEALKTLFGEDFSNRIPAASAIDAITPSLPDLKAIFGKAYLFKTSRGDFTVELNDLAPLSAFNFAELVAKNFYHDVVIHRVVPHFVMQAGDPRGDGYGGPGYVIRDEVSSESHLRGTVGMATAGKDTGGSQFFVNHGGNFHLDGVYTNFATVVTGMHIVDRLEQGDLIFEIRVK